MTKRGTRGTAHPRRKFTLEQAAMIRAEYAETREIRPLARRWGCDQTTVYDIVHGKTYVLPGPLDVGIPTPVELPPDRPTSPVELYRYERDRAKYRRAAAAKVEMAALQKLWRELLAREAEAHKGGRPKASGRGGQKSIQVPRSTRNRFPDVSRDPADALLSALQPFGESSAA